MTIARRVLAALALAPLAPVLLLMLVAKSLHFEEAAVVSGVHPSFGG